MKAGARSFAPVLLLGAIAACQAPDRPPERMERGERVGPEAAAPPSWDLGSWESEGGVTRELALHRARVLGGVEYRFELDLTRGPQEVPGRARIAFRWHDPDGRPLVLDFAAAIERIQEVRVNGRPVEAWPVADRHLVLRAEELRPSARNEVTLSFDAQGPSLHRMDDLVHTLFVPDRAHGTLPLFDQPDLKATFRLSLRVPNEWRALSNASVEGQDMVSVGQREPGADARSAATEGHRWVRFQETAPIAPYLFAFAAGPLEELRMDEGPEGRVVRLLHRPAERDAVHREGPEILDLHTRALDFLEGWTGSPLPFAPLEVLLVPGLPVGGMEHPGLVLYRAERLLLPRAATPANRMERGRLVAHEMAHMWFGNSVTLPWFDDLWLKEGFAELLARRFARDTFPQVDGDLYDLLTLHRPARNLARSRGRRPLRSELAELSGARALYGPGVYATAAMAMMELERMVGAEAFQEGSRRFLEVHAHGTGGWEELRAALEGRGVEGDRRLSGAGHLETRLEDWARTWLRREGPSPEDLSRPPPGTASGPEEESLGYRRARLQLSLHERVLDGSLDAEILLPLLLSSLEVPDELLLRQSTELLEELWWGFVDESRRALWAPRLEEALERGIRRAGDPALRALHLQAFRRHFVTSDAAALASALATGELRLPGFPLTEDERADVALALAVRESEGWEDVAGGVREDLGDGRAGRRLDYLLPAVSPDPAIRRVAFRTLMGDAVDPRAPWALEALALLNHPLRQEEALSYLPPGLARIETLKQDGWLFLPEGWIRSLLGGHSSREAAALVDGVLARGGVPSRMEPAVLHGADFLFRAAGRR